MAAFAGLYRSAELDTTYKLSISMGNLTLRNRGDPALKLIPIMQSEFDSEIGTLVFHRDADHRISGLSMFSPNTRKVRFEKVNDVQCL